MKVASDAASKAINTAKPVDVTVHDLSARRQPVPWSAKMTRKMHFDAAAPKKPVEGTDWRISEVKLVKWKLEPDEDIHVVIQDPDPKFRTLMTIEFPNPDCEAASRSNFLANIKAARAAIVKKFGKPPKTYKALKGSGSLSGIGFFDKRHGQPGANPIEVHPVLSFFAGP